MNYSIEQLDHAEDVLLNAVPASPEFPAFDASKFPYRPERKIVEPADRFSFMKHLKLTLYPTTESYVYGLLGVDLAYLYQAFFDNSYIQLSPDTLLARLLAKHLGTDSAVWGYVEFIQE
jgi:hypothetical protein